MHSQSGIKTPKAKIAEVAQLVEHNLAKVRVAGSSPVFRSCFQIKPRNSSELRGFLFIVFSSEKHAYLFLNSCLCFDYFMLMFSSFYAYVFSKR